MYNLKCIKFLGRKTNVILQNENGPCPLIAISNVLLLQGKIDIHLDMKCIDLYSLLQMVTEKILELNSSRDEQVLKMVDSVISVVPKLENGLDVNLFFDDVNHFEFTEELTCFDSLGISLFHGWVIDPQDKNYELISKQSYNTAIFTLIEYQTRYDKSLSPVAAKEVKNEVKNDTGSILSKGNDETSECWVKGIIIESFLNETASQLTYFGLLRLYECIKERQLCVFFRNNHFSTLFRINGKLYLLVTDQGYIDEPKVVWELLDEIDGY